MLMLMPTSRPVQWKHRSNQGQALDSIRQIIKSLFSNFHLIALNYVVYQPINIDVLSKS